MTLPLKALIISGGTIGLGVPGIYYSYPYISNLVSPSSEVEQKPTGEQSQVKLAQEEGTTNQGKSPEESSAENTQAVNTVAGGEKGDTQTDSSGKAAETNSPVNQGDQGKPNGDGGGTNGNAGQESGTPSQGGTGTQDSSQPASNSSK